MEITPSDATLGALVRGVDLATPLEANEIEEIEAAWHRFGVLVFKDQFLDDEQQIAFSRYFGRLELGLGRGPSAVGRITNVTKDGEVAQPTSLQVRFHEGNTFWHSDSSYKHVGAKASILSARKVPTVGGETEWADMRAGYDALDASMQSWLEDKIAVHSYVYSHSWHGGLEILDEEQLAHLPPVEHPVVTTHPGSGRKHLFVGRHASHIIGEDEEESRALLKQLTEHCGQPGRTWKHRWEDGDIGIWDNRCVLHRGHLWPADEARVMVRTTIAGDAAHNEWVLAAGHEGRLVV